MSFKSLESVLDDSKALNAFRDWIRLDPLRSEDCVDLYFAIKSYKEWLSRSESRTAATLALTLHQKFISLRTGLCSFLPTPARQEMSNRIHSLSDSLTTLSDSLFDPVFPPLMAFLRTWHSQFVCSEPFHTLISTASDSSYGSEAVYMDLLDVSQPQQCTGMEPSCSRSHAPSSSRSHAPSSSRSHAPSSSRGHASSCSQPPPTTLMRSSKPQSILKEHYIRHERPEEREAFVAHVSSKLQAIEEAVARHGGGVYPRQLDKLGYESRGPQEKQAVLVTEQGGTTSDEEVEKYVGKFEKDSPRKRSVSASPPLFRLSAAPSQGPPPNPYGQDGFAPPPSKGKGYDFNNVVIPRALISTPNSRNPRSVGLRDSSGFCSGESAYFSDRSFDHSKPANANSFGTQSTHSNPPSFTPFSAQTLQRKHHMMPNQNVFATLPRRPIDSPSSYPIRCSLWKEGEEAPYVAILDCSKPIRLADFRKTFGVSRKENTRMQFKSACEDGLAPFQWTILCDDHAIVPIFEGRITAEARRYVDSD